MPKHRGNDLQRWECKTHWVSALIKRKEIHVWKYYPYDSYMVSILTDVTVGSDLSTET